MRLTSRVAFLMAFAAMFIVGWWYPNRTSGFLGAAILIAAGVAYWRGKPWRPFLWALAGIVVGLAVLAAFNRFPGSDQDVFPVAWQKAMQVMGTFLLYVLGLTWAVATAAFELARGAVELLRRLVAWTSTRLHGNAPTPDRLRRQAKLGHGNILAVPEDAAAGV